MKTIDSKGTLRCVSALALVAAVLGLALPTLVTVAWRQAAPWTPVYAAALQDVAHTLYVPHVLLDERRDTDILLTNASVDAQTVRFIFHSAPWSHPSSLPADVAIHLQGLSQRIVSLRQAFQLPDEESLEGWLSIESDSAQMAGQYALVDTRAGRAKQRLLKLSGSLSKSLVFAGMSRSKDISSRIGLVNPHPQPASVTVGWFDRSGHPLLTANRLIEPYGLYFESADEVWNGRDLFVGHVEVSSSKGLVGFQTFQSRDIPITRDSFPQTASGSSTGIEGREAVPQTTTGSATLQMQSHEEASDVLYFPMLAELESDFYAGLAITNPSDQPVEIQLEAFDMDGKPIEPKAGADTRRLPARGTWTALVSDIFQTPQKDTLRGYVKAQVRIDRSREIGGGGAITGVALFGNSSLTRLSGITAALQPSRNYLFAGAPHNQIVPDETSKILLYNPAAQETRIRTYRFDPEGRLQLVRSQAIGESQGARQKGAPMNRGRMLELGADDDASGDSSVDPVARSRAIGELSGMVLVSSEEPIFATQVYEGKENLFLVSGNRFEKGQEKLVEDMVVKAAAPHNLIVRGSDKGSHRKTAAAPTPFLSGDLNPHGIALLSSTNSATNLDRAVIVHPGGEQKATLINLTTNSTIATGAFVVGGIPEGVATDVARGHAYVTRLAPPSSLVTTKVLRYAAGVATLVENLSNPPTTNYVALGSTGGPVPGTAINRALLVNEGSSPPSVGVFQVTDLSRTFLASVSLGGSLGPRHVAVFSSSLTPRAVVANSGSGNATIIELLTNTVVGTVATGSHPFGVAINGAGTRAIVTNLGSDNATLINLAGAGSVVATISELNSPRGVAIDTGRFPNVAVVANSANNTVAFINMETGAIVGTAPTGYLPYGVAVDPNNHLAYITNTGDNNVTVVSVPDPTPTASLTAAKSVSIFDSDNSGTLNGGDVLVYVVTVDNSSLSIAATLRYRDDLPANTNTPTVVNAAGGTVSLPIPTRLQIDGIVVPPLSGRTIAFLVLVNGGLQPGTQICNQGFFTGRSAGFTFDDLSFSTDNPLTSAPLDPTCIFVEDSMVVASKTASIQVDGGTPGVLDPGDRMRYRVTIRNRDLAIGASIQFLDRVPANTTFVPGSLVLTDPPAGPVVLVDPAGGSINLSGLTLNPGEVITIQFEVTVNPGTVGQTIYNIGYVIVAQPGKGPYVLVTHDPTNTDTTDNAAESGNNPAVASDDNPTRRRVGT